MPSIHTALESIHAFRNSHNNTMYAAEADISSFYDCVSHRKVIECINHVAHEAGVKIDPIAKRVLKAYLACYNFQENIEKAESHKLKHKYSHNSYFPWPKAQIRELHNKRGRLPKIGIPQGGALSCFLSNVILHEADKAIFSVRKRRKKPLLYMRYCDDMIIISTDRHTCKAAFNAYLITLQNLKLPAHPPKEYPTYVKGFWDGKSKSPYEWGARPSIPWLSFLGYQIRFDGTTRVRAKSIKKHENKIISTVDDVLRSISLAAPKSSSCGGVRVSAGQILYRTKLKLIALSVGRRKWGMETPKTQNELLPMCWASGFKGLVGKNLIVSQLKHLDRVRNRQISRLHRKLKASKEKFPSNEEAPRIKPIKYFGHPFSYTGQFVNKQKPNDRT